jgi:uncharacterized membrane protein YuzA (DUF378 family)
MRNPYDAIGRLGLLLAIVGAVNWLLVGLFEWNLVQWLFTDSGTQTVSTVGERVVYIVVGVGGVLAIPMLAASLARARSRGVEHAERDSSDQYVETDDTAYYLGAPKNEREKSREPRPLRVAESEPAHAEGETPLRSADSPRSDIDERLRYGTVEETDEGFDESTEERHRAA